MRRSLKLAGFSSNPLYYFHEMVDVPPRTQRYMFYCELRGIMSEHARIEDAGISLLSYLNFFKGARLLPLAGIYEYKDRKWVRVKKLTSDAEGES